MLRENSMLVSVVIPTFNRAELLERAIHSVLSQTLTGLELIIVDDGSTDDTQNRAALLLEADHRIVYLKHEKNCGAQAARNTGIQAAKGEFIAFLDSDNEWLPSKLEKQMMLISQNTDPIGVVYCDYQEVSTEGRVLNNYIARYRGLIYKKVLCDWLTDTSTLIVRKDFLEKIHGFDEKVQAYQEWDLCIRLAKECQFDFVPECLTIYHQHALPSISKDRLRDAFGYLGIVDSNRDEIINECGRKKLSEHYLRIGRLFIFANHFELARAYFLKSIRYNLLNIKGLMHFGASILGKDVYRFLGTLKHG
jgi:glycosyltransferase involved in cell wall biosynthesis